MSNPFVVTINRQFGSGGREIGKRLAAILDIAYLDKELLSLAAQKSGISEKAFEKADEKPEKSYLYALSTAAYGSYSVPFSYPNVLTNDRLFAIQADVIRKEAAEKNCVIIGRCADDILSDHPCHINLFVHAPFEVRQKRIMELYHLDVKQAKDLIAKTDKTRASYYYFYTNQKWDDLLNYDLSVDSSVLGYDDTAQLLAEFIRKKAKIK
ncbi:MAG: AAA family ATPase [Oscillospiraceae bacterium]